MSRGPTIVPLAPAHLAGLVALQAAIILAFIDIRCAGIPLALFLITCFVAPFFPRLSFYLPIVSRGKRDSRAVALTFDDGPDPDTTPALLDLLAQQGVPATFFVTGRRATLHRGLMREILSRGHSVGNHSYHHSPLLMLKKTDTLREEINKTREVLLESGIASFAFRPPAGITNPRLWRVLLESGLYCVNFSCRARDAGNRRIRNLSKKILRRVKPGDIILMHDVAPGGNFNVRAWLDEVSAVLDGLKARGIAVIPLSDCIGRPIMKPADSSSAAAGPASVFYDSITGCYDAERCGSRIYRKERELFNEHFLKLLTPEHRVLEIGAGTGLFTRAIARHCREVTAVELSENMAAVLKQKESAEQLSNIIVRTGDIETMELDGGYDVICSFSCFEYVGDLGSLFNKISPCIKPGGAFYFTTAHRSFFRFFTQVGNAMRQGVWLHSRTERRIRKSLAAAGFRPEKVSTHVLKCGFAGGMLAEALAIKERRDQ
ncbi:MAG: hypothetical protein A2176_02085 [Spirochaetes bacterium RBG_13_51_14]|nr:MAG: hypothetical protein A2176_02085 [Spirochaetes bacterium RBG_13_51_14]